MADDHKNDDDDRVGYGKPPREHRFKKGQSGNPAGRPKKQKPDQDLRAILERIGNEEVAIGGVTLTLREVELRALQHKAAKGDVAASKHLMKLREQAGCDKPKREGGVLVVPGMQSLDEWSAAAARQQAPYRENSSEYRQILARELPAGPTHERQNQPDGEENDD